MGLGWDVKKVKTFLGRLKDGPTIDLDASCVMFDDAKEIIDTIWFRQLESRDGSIVHTGDNRTGAGEGDDEQIIVNLPQVPSEAAALIFVVNSFTGQDFSQIENAFCRIVDAATNREIARYDLSCQGAHTAQIIAKVYRHSGEWKMAAIGENTSGRTFHDLLPAMLPHL
jgi:tellurium resistance protein TerZ